MAQLKERTEGQLWWRHLLSVLIAPVVMAVVIPLSIADSTGVQTPDLASPARIGLAVVGGLSIVVGLGLFVWTVVLFDRTGRGTLGFGELLGEPVHLVVRGPYRHVRNPMISGVFCILLGEAAITASTWLLLWSIVFFGVLTAFIRWGEEPHLKKRYGDAYVEYWRNVPRWVPRPSAWSPSSFRP